MTKEIIVPHGKFRLVENGLNGIGGGNSAFTVLGEGGGWQLSVKQIQKAKLFPGHNYWQERGQDFFLTSTTVCKFKQAAGWE